MNDLRPDRRPRQAPPKRFVSLILTVAVHIGLLAFLFFGVNWQNKPLGSLEVGLAVGPSGSAPEPAPPPPPPPPEPPKPPPPEPPKPEPPKEPPPKPDIATKNPEPPKPEKKPERKPPEPPPLKPIDLQKQLEKKLDQAIERSAEARKVNDILGGGQRSGRAAPGELDAYRAALVDKFRRNLNVLPGLFSGNPEALFEIEQVKGSGGGEVINVRLKRSSGNHALDQAMERAIRKSNPLPLPDNPTLFTRKLDVTFSPLEE